MKIPAFLVVCLPLLAGCTDADWDGATRGWLDTETPAADAAMPEPAPKPVVVAQPADPAFCQAVAKQDSLRGGFDAATQARVYDRSYAQCISVFGSISR